MYDIAPHPDFNFKVGDVVLRLPSIPDPGEGEGSASADGAAEAAAPMEEAAAGGAGQDSLSGLLLTRATRWAASLAGGAAAAAADEDEEGAPTGDPEEGGFTALRWVGEVKEIGPSVRVKWMDGRVSRAAAETLYVVNTEEDDEPLEEDAASFDEGDEGESRGGLAGDGSEGSSGWETVDSDGEGDAQGSGEEADAVDDGEEEREGGEQGASGDGLHEPLDATRAIAAIENAERALIEGGGGEEEQGRAAAEPAEPSASQMEAEAGEGGERVLPEKARRELAKHLRAVTSQSARQCEKALQANGDDIERATAWLISQAEAASKASPAAARRLIAQADAHLAGEADPRVAAASSQAHSDEEDYATADELDVEAPAGAPRGGGGGAGAAGSAGAAGAGGRGGDAAGGGGDAAGGAADAADGDAGGAPAEGEDEFSHRAIEAAGIEQFRVVDDEDALELGPPLLLVLRPE